MHIAYPLFTCTIDDVKTVESKIKSHSLNSYRDTEKWLPGILDFLSEIGIPFEFGEVPQTSFLPGIELNKGVVVIDQKQLLYAGDVLHEAGHLALVPKNDRPKISGDIQETFPQYAGLEMAVLCWSYLAALHLNVPADVLFHTDGYKGEASWLIEQFSSGNFVGLPFLEWTEIVERQGAPTKTPKVLKWLRD